ncbi:MAG: hypothetical protein ACETWK_03650 [Candidatus Aminicenantaceae bacterium]
MVNLMLMKANAQTSSVEIMDMDILKKIEVILKKERRKNIFLHMEGQKEHPQLQEIIDFLTEKDYRITLNLNIAKCETIIGKDIHVIYNARPLFYLDDSECEVRKALSTGLNDFYSRQLSLFLPLPAHTSTTNQLLQLVKAHQNIESVIIGVGWETWHKGPQSILEKDFPEWSKTLQRIIKDLTAEGIEANFACGLPLCLFTRRQLGFLVTLKIKWPIAYCLPKYYVDPLGNVSYCQCIGSPKPINLLEEQSFERVMTKFNQWMRLRWFCSLAEEDICRSLRAGACGSGCLAHSLENWRGPGK